jgi:hypothetical protein
VCVCVCVSYTATPLYVEEEERIKEFSIVLSFIS